MENVPEKEIMGHIADLFKGFADPTRVHILYLLAEGELCVSDIAEQVEAKVRENLMKQASAAPKAPAKAADRGVAISADDFDDED